MSFKKLRILIVVLIVIATGAFYFYTKYNDKNLDISLDVPSEVMSGVPFNFKVNYSNNSGEVLNAVGYTVFLPEGLAFIGSDASKMIDNKNVGDIGNGSLGSENYSLVALAGEGSNKKIKVTFNYSPASINAKFEKTFEKEIFVNSSGVVIEMKAPDKILSGAEFETEITCKNVSGSDFSGLELKIDYPPSFTFVSSSLKADKNNNVWSLGGLNKGSESKFSIKGTIIAPDNSNFIFKASLGGDVGGHIYTINSKDFSFTVAPSPVSLGIVLNDSQDFIAKPGQDLNYVLNYVNNTDVALRAVVLRAQLVGDMFNFNTLETNGVLRSNNNTLVWDSSNVPELDSLPPHGAGSVKFKIKVKDDYTLRRLGDKNFVLKINAEIESPTIPSFVTTGKTFNVAKLETKISGKTEVASVAYFRDAKSGILNKGLWPIRVGQPTNFTIHWLIKNYATDAANIELRATLPEGVRFVNAAKSSTGQSPFYDEKNNQMVWAISRISANRGVVDDAPEAIFQIEATPNASMIGKYMTILGDAIVKGTDDFTALPFNITAGAVDTLLPSDTTVKAGEGMVQP